MKEIWKDIGGYEGHYQVSSTGKVKSLERLTKFKNRDYVRVEKEKLLTLQVQHKGYHKIMLRRDNKTKGHFVHRLVAKAFIPNPENKPQVNHIDGDKLNNNVYNLEWITNLDNMRHAYQTGIRNNGDDAPVTIAKLKPVAQYTKEGELIATYPSVKEAGISQCCLGKYKSTGGYVFKYI